MSEMLDRVAKAISESFHEEGYIEGISDPDEWNEFLKAARAVLQVMYEPTEEMLHAAMLTAVRENKGIEYAPLGGWRAMIDEALR